MSELVDWLLERIAEDERVALDIESSDDADREHIADGMEWVNPSRLGSNDMWRLAVPSARVLAECEAKRRIIELHGNQMTPDGTPYYSPELRALTLPYADRTGYREEWRP